MLHLKYNGKELNIPLRCKGLDYVVTGTGRCGTVYMAKLLSSIGIGCGHETIFQPDGIEFAIERIKNSTELPALNVSFAAKLTSKTDEKQGISWFQGDFEICADSSYMAAPYLDHPLLEKTSIIHVVRNPIDVINSFLVGLVYFTPSALEDDFYLPGVPSRKDFHEFIYSHVPDLKNDNLLPVERTALFYIKWNEMIEQKAKNKRYCFLRIEDEDRTGLFKFIGCNPETYYLNKEINKKIYIPIYDYNSINNEVIRTDLLKIAKRYHYIA
jgi:hypothetical protein